MPNRTLRIRMYKPGLGDCFLLSFPTSAGKEFHILIDCGALSSADNVLTDVVNDIRQRTSGSIDVVIATHEHWDHISGFSQAKKIFDKIKVRSVWTSWTEEPGNDAAAILRERFKKKKAAVDKAVGMMPSKIQDKQLGMYKEKITEVLQFSGGLGVSKANKTATAWKNYLGLSKKKKYCSPKRAPIEIDDVNDVRVFVLGPPENPDYIKKKLSKVETYDDGGHAFAAFSGFAAAFAGNSGDGGEEQERAYPFDKRYRVLPKTAKKNPFFTANYGFNPKGADRWRRIDDDWLAQAGELALHLDSYTNNTCFALAIELGTSGKVLLFPGDAQVGNWLSWSELSWKLKDSNGSSRTVDIDDLLSRTVFYKVGHHGSHNATLRAKGLERMTSEDLVAMIPVDRATAENQDWEFPYPPLWDSLKTRCSGRVLLADTSDMTEIESDLRELLSNEDFKSFENSVDYGDLFIEHSIEF